MRPRILVLGTGGTIAGTARSRTGKAYAAGEVALETMLDAVRALGLEAELIPRTIAAIGSQDIGWTEWDALHAAIAEAEDDPSFAGIIVTHGTDTAEETAFLLDLTLPAGKPVVLVGAMRPSDAVGSDGMRNFANAVRLAGDPESAGRGVLVVMADTVFAAADVRKAATANIDAFRGYPRGPLARVTPATLDWFAPAHRIGRPARYAWPEALPRVAILTAGAGMDAKPVEALLGIGCKGLVLAGMGQGNAPRVVIEALAKAAANGVPVVRSARVDEGMVDRNVEVDDDATGLVAARALGPAKARILLMVLIANGVTDAARIQEAFDGR
ncbi:asparaginase [Erythrobacter sp. HL-111]|uniref:asparaginase n=1 Tax=Erythrobacter sp. HL-111 TaxID=1798193 RepID=UPI0006D963AD|nr:MAG: L-asparaginase AnsA [Erythrobacteraceae bacterium HL-111]SDR68004.1 L-asparaginase [Erythrobacter sp. HL-111]